MCKAIFFSLQHRFVLNNYYKSIENVFINVMMYFIFAPMYYYGYDFFKIIIIFRTKVRILCSSATGILVG